MTFRITGLDPAPFASLFQLDDAALAARSIARMIVSACPGFPCRISLDDARLGETVLLLNHVSVAEGPFGARHAIFVAQGHSSPAIYDDAVPPALDRRLLSLRGFGGDGMMLAAALAQPGEAHPVIRQLFADPAVRYIHAHNAIRGCFAAAVERT